MKTTTMTVVAVFLLSLAAGADRPSPEIQRLLKARDEQVEAINKKFEEAMLRLRFKAGIDGDDATMDAIDEILRGKEVDEFVGEWILSFEKHADCHYVINADGTYVGQYAVSRKKYTGKWVRKDAKHVDLFRDVEPNVLSYALTFVTPGAAKFATRYDNRVFTARKVK